MFEILKPKTSHQDGPLTDRSGSIDRNEKRGTLLGLHVVCPAPVTIIVTGMARGWVCSLFVWVVVTTGIRASRRLVIGSQMERLRHRLCVHVGIVGREHISWICASLRNNQGRRPWTKGRSDHRVLIARALYNLSRLMSVRIGQGYRAAVLSAGDRIDIWPFRRGIPTLLWRWPRHLSETCASADRWSLCYSLDIAVFGLVSDRGIEYNPAVR